MCGPVHLLGIEGVIFLGLVLVHGLGLVWQAIQKLDVLLTDCDMRLSFLMIQDACISGGWRMRLTHGIIVFMDRCRFVERDNLARWNPEPCLDRQAHKLSQVFHNGFGLA